MFFIQYNNIVIIIIIIIIIICSRAAWLIETKAKLCSLARYFITYLNIMNILITLQSKIVPYLSVTTSYVVTT